jgi:GDP-L-fucose synthase
VLDVTKLRELGWTPSIDLDTGIRTTYQWFLDQEARHVARRGIDPSGDVDPPHRLVEVLS